MVGLKRLRRSRLGLRADLQHPAGRAARRRAAAARVHRLGAAATSATGSRTSPRTRAGRHSERDVQAAADALRSALHRRRAEPSDIALAARPAARPAEPRRPRPEPRRRAPARPCAQPVERRAPRTCRSSSTCPSLDRAGRARASPRAAAGSSRRRPTRRPCSIASTMRAADAMQPDARRTSSSTRSRRGLVDLDLGSPSRRARG